MAIDFPNSPSTSDIHTVSGKQWQWDGEKWTAYGVSLNPGVLKVDSGNSRVGINQTSPAYSLDVTGTARITGDLTVQGTTTTIESAAVNTSLIFEGATADSYETTLTLVDPTADRTITLPDSTGTVALTSAVLPLTGGAMTGAITTNSTFDGVDIATRDAILTSTTTTADAALPKAGGAMTGAITTNSTFDGVDIATRDAVLTSTTTTANAALPKAGGTLSGAIVAADQIISAPVMKDYAETKAAMAAHDVDLTLGNVQTYTLSGNQTLTFSNPPASGSAGSFTLIVTNGASATLTWPTSVDWAGGTAPTLTASGIDILTFTTVDGGTIWYGFLAGADMK